MSFPGPHIRIALHAHVDVEGIDPEEGPTDDEQHDRLDQICHELEEALGSVEIEGLTIQMVCIEGARPSDPLGELAKKLGGVIEVIVLGGSDPRPNGNGNGNGNGKPFKPKSI